MSDTGSREHDNRTAGATDPFASATELAAGLRRKDFSSRELLEVYLMRVEEHNPLLNAIVTLDRERALAEASAADDALTRGEPLGPLHGLPVTVKDSFESARMRTTSGAEELADHVPVEDAVVVERLRAAGAIVFGKTNLPKYAADAQTYNDLFGVTNNPWDVTRTPGGSSGGAAAAIAAGLTGLELGSDIGGSLRIPAHFCGVYTLKPTFGIVPHRGHIPPPPGALVDADVLAMGPLARDARDLDLCLSVICGAESDKASAWRLELPDPRGNSLASYRIAVCLDDPYSTIDTAIAEVYSRTIDDLRGAGARVDEVQMPVPLADAHDVAQRLVQAEMARWQSEDGFRELLRRAESADPNDDSAPVKWARNNTQRVRDYQFAAEARLKMKESWAAFFRNYDALLCPVTPTTALPHDHNPDVDARTIVVNGEKRAYGDQFAWLQSIGVVHLPAGVAPVGLTADGLPVGVQIVSAEFEDRTVIDVATRIGEVVGGFQEPPGFEG